jgi:hypothetical protein
LNKKKLRKNNPSKKQPNLLRNKKKLSNQKRKHQLKPPPPKKNPHLLKLNQVEKIPKIIKNKIKRKISFLGNFPIYHRQKYPTPDD